MLEPTSDSLVLRFKMSLEDLVRPDRELALLKPDLFTSDPQPYFPSPERARPIALRYPYRVETRAEVRFPERWRIQQAPADQALENRFGLYERRCRGDPGVLTLERREEVRQVRIPAADYGLARDWDALHCTSDRERVVLELP